MANEGEKAKERLAEITECPICMSSFTDPRMLPCIHTFCFECLKRTAETEQRKPGDKMPCPLCRKEFIIPANGVNGVQKNFFMENLLEFKTTLQTESAVIICNMCNIRNEGKPGQIPRATMRCVDCKDNYCDSCARVHQFQKISKDHKIVTIGSDITSERKRFVSMKTCTKHRHEPLRYYCADCKKIVCVSCFVESHKFHDCKDVTTVDEEFRQKIEKKALNISIYADEMLSIKSNESERRERFLSEIDEKERKIHKKSRELKDMIDRHTKSLLDDLSEIKSRHLKIMEIQMEEIERCCAILRSFESYCTELALTGSASDICSSVDELIIRSDELERDHESFLCRPHQSVEVSFKATDLGDVKNASTNLVGNVEETPAKFENCAHCAVVVGFDDSLNMTKAVVKINLHRPNEISTLEEIPTEMAPESFAAVYCNTVYVTGLGINYDEIWKYNTASAWVKCASLVQGRLRHSAAFIDEVLYICGGLLDLDESLIDSVEAYNAITDKCTVVGKLVHCVQSSGNCVAFKSSLYIFGGKDKDDNEFNDVQVYNTKENKCSLLSGGMLRPCYTMRAVLWGTYIILLGRYTCFILNLETECWQAREQFKTDVSHFGLVLQNERLFVIGGGNRKKDEKGKITWTLRDDVRYVPLIDILDDEPVEWKFHGQLPEPSLVDAFAKLRFLV